MNIRKNWIIYITIIFIAIIGIFAFFIFPKIQRSKVSNTATTLGETIKQKERTIKKDIEDVDTMWELAELYSRIDRDYERAQELLDTILNKEPDHELAMHLKGVVLTEQGKFIEAIDQFNSLLAMDENDPVTLQNLSKLYFIFDIDRSLNYAKEAVEAAIWQYRQDSEYDYSPVFNEWEQAIQNFDIEFQIDPAIAVLNMEEFFMAEPTLLIEVYKFALDMLENTSLDNAKNLLERAGLLYTEIGNNEEAVDIYRKLTEISPEYGKGYVLLSNRLAKVDRLDELADIMERLKSQDKMIVEKNIIDILMQYEKGETKEAMERLEIMNVDEYNIFIAHNMGILYETLGKKDDAIRCYNRALGYSDEDYDFWQAINHETTKAVLYLDSK
ncbi:MAG: tetratricopeptide repeat protein [Clostridiales bacterium]|nr:tetratricopeptide repeat protein [Clostridiales bacterium]